MHRPHKIFKKRLGFITIRFGRESFPYEELISFNVSMPSQAMHLSYVDGRVHTRKLPFKQVFIDFSITAYFISIKMFKRIKHKNNDL